MKWRTRPASREGRRWRGWLGRVVGSAGRSLKTKLTAGARCQRRREWRRERAQRAFVPSARGPACGPISRPLAAQWFFLFLFVQFLLYV